MSLAAGARLGGFQILAPLGTGGMGEVYRAHDSELGREVALKVLSPAVSGNPDSLSRFEREARLLASLNHPNIAAIYGVTRQDSTRALVLELVPGLTLADHIARGPMAIDRALKIADQIAEALDAAHERGIVHRDLKPANVKVTGEGTVKVLDFGIAKALAAEDDGTTVDVNLTSAGVVIGTRAYMSPEQTRALPVDKRTDIWAFGCVLYEMLTGRRAFGGSTATEITTAVLEQEPDWSALPDATSPAVRRLLRRTLEKDPRRRLRDIADARIELTETAISGGPAAPPPGRGGSWRVHGAWAAAVAAALALGAVSQRTTTVPAAVHLALAVPPVSPQQAAMLAMSSDGRRLAVATAAGLVVQDFGATESTLLPGTAGATSPVFSADGAWLAFQHDARLKKMLATGGSPIIVADLPPTFRGFSWGDDETLVMGHTNDVLSRIAPDGTLTPLTVLDAAQEETSHRWPFILPGSRVILYAAGPSVSANDWNSAHIVAQSLASGERRVIAQRGAMPAYADGHVFFVAGQELLAQRFDPARLEVSGPVVTVARRLIRVSSGATWYAVAANGTLAALHGPPSGERKLVWATRDGTITPLPLPPGPYRNAQLSPDGARVAVTVSNPDSDIWVADVVRGSQTRITSDGRSLWPVWTADGASLIHASMRGGPAQMVTRRADGTGTATVLVANRYINRPSAASKGAFAYTQVQDSGGELFLRLPDGRDRLFASGRGDQGEGRFSPDGSWVAFRSTETGAPEVFVQPFADESGARQQISIGGGQSPVWSHDGRELFFLRGNEVWAAPAPRKGGTAFGEARRLFKMAGDLPESVLDVAPDGRFLLVTGDPILRPTDFRLTLNVSDVVRRLATAR